MAGRTSIRVSETSRLPAVNFRVTIRFVFSGVIAILVAGCAPHFYGGRAAVLDESSGFEVIRKERSWGDCYFKLKKMPTVYQLWAERYTITVTQGDRYWPQFFLQVLSTEGLGLTLSGEHIEHLDKLVNYERNDSRQLRESRRTNPTHQTVRLTEVPGGVLNIAVIDDSDAVIGTHNLQFRLKDVSCFEWDAI